MVEHARNVAAMNAWAAIITEIGYYAAFTNSLPHSPRSLIRTTMKTHDYVSAVSQNTNNTDLIPCIKT
jgi:hypothetical protein